MANTADVPGKGYDDECVATETGVAACKGANKVVGLEGDFEAELVRSNTSSSLRPVYCLAALSIFSYSAVADFSLWADLRWTFICGLMKKQFENSYGSTDFLDQPRKCSPKRLII